MTKLRAKMGRLRDLLLHYSTLRSRRFAMLDEIRRQYACDDNDLQKSDVWTSAEMSGSGMFSEQKVIKEGG